MAVVHLHELSDERGGLENIGCGGRFWGGG